VHNTGKCLLLEILLGSAFIDMGRHSDRVEKGQPQEGLGEGGCRRRWLGRVNEATLVPTYALVK